jgi:DNA-binding FadR family transcriptional regulator
VNVAEGQGQPPRVWLFEPIDGMRAHELVVEQIVFAIRSGAVGVGERLPSIEHLAETFQVSKPTVGEAIRVLVDYGVVESRRGVHGGVTVIEDNVPVTLLGMSGPRRELSARELVEARRPIEIRIAKLAAERMTPADGTIMAESIARLRDHVGDDLSVRLHYDHLFHYAMGRAARSDLLAYYQHQILKQLVVTCQEYFHEKEDPRLVIELHERTLEAIQGGEGDLIAAAMDDHLRPLESSTAEPVAKA